MVGALWEFLRSRCVYYYYIFPETDITLIGTWFHGKVHSSGYGRLSGKISNFFDINALNDVKRRVGRTFILFLCLFYKLYLGRDERKFLKK